MDTSKIKVILVVIISAFLALYLGVSAATAQMETVAWILAVGSVVFLLALGKHVWVIIPISLALLGNISLIPGAPAPWWVATMAVAGITALRFLMRRTEVFVIRFTWLDFAIFLQIIAVGQAFMRNPTGLSILGGDVVGGKPYIIYGFAFMAFFLLSIIKTDLKMVKRVVIFIILMTVIDGAIFLSSFMVPALAAIVLPIYTGVSFESATS
jgi:hypothetical protein